MEGVNDNYVGETPDIGAYEHAAPHYWIPGHKREAASIPVPPDGAVKAKADADLMFLEAYRAKSHHIYFGTDEAAVEEAGVRSAAYRQNISNNIYTPGQMEPGKTYYWRVDAVLDDRIVKGHVWKFTVENELKTHKTIAGGLLN